MPLQIHVAARRLSQKTLRHASSEKIAAFIDQNLSSEDRERVIQHLAECSRCRKIAAEAIRSQGAVDDPDRRSN